jgi:hypothetical protein
VGCAIAQAVSRRLPTSAAWVRAQVGSCGICGGQSGTGAGFLRVLWFPLPNRIPPIAPQSSSIIWGCYDTPNSGRSTKWTQSHPMREMKEVQIVHYASSVIPNLSIGYAFDTYILNYTLLGPVKIISYRNKIYRVRQIRASYASHSICCRVMAPPHDYRILAYRKSPP